MVDQLLTRYWIEPSTLPKAFGRVEGSIQYLVKSWSTIVELISVWKRLREFEAKLNLSDELSPGTSWQ